MKGITDADYLHAKRVCENFKSLFQYHNLYIQSNVLLLADVFDNFQNTCFKIYQINLSCFFTAPGLACQAAFKRPK